MEAEDYRKSSQRLGEILDGALARCDREQRRALEQMCAEAVRSCVNYKRGEDDRNKPIGHSLYRFLLETMAKAALDYALETGFDTPVLFELELNKALEIVDDLRSALIDDARSDKSLNFWKDVPSPIDKIKANKVPYIERSQVECVVGNYLALPYRSLTMDRYLVRILTAMELYAFGDEMFNEKTFGLFPARSPLKQRHALVAYLFNLIANGLFYAGIASLALWARSNGWIGDTGAVWTTGICLFLFLWSSVWSTVRLPLAWSEQSKARSRVINLLGTMTMIYSELRSEGPISAKHIYERASKATEEGVVWPAPLFALLDDIISRTGRF
jgi:hypothetical protein